LMGKQCSHPERQKKHKVKSFRKTMKLSHLSKLYTEYHKFFVVRQSQREKKN